MGRPVLALLPFLASCAGAGTASPESAAILERLRPALALKGDPARGRLLFEKSCLQCHRAGAEGHDAGPDVSAFRSRPPEQLLVDIVDPNREVKPQYVGHRVLTEDGDLFDGLLVRSDASGVILRRAQGETDTIPRSKIRKHESTGLSLMPEGLEQGLDAQQMADLLSFIRGYN